MIKTWSSILWCRSKCESRLNQATCSLSMCVKLIASRAQASTRVGRVVASCRPERPNAPVPIAPVSCKEKFNNKNNIIQIFFINIEKNDVSKWMSNCHIQITPGPPVAWFGIVHWTTSQSVYKWGAPPPLVTWRNRLWAPCTLLWKNNNRWK